MKRRVHDPRGVVRDMLEGLCERHPALARLEGKEGVLRAGLPAPASRPVAIWPGALADAVTPPRA